VVDQNLLHGLINEDPAAEPFDRFPERIQLTARVLADLRPDVILLQEVAPGKGEDYGGDVRTVLLDALGADYRAVFGDITGGPIDTGGIGQMTLTRLPVVSSENHAVSPGRSVHRVTVQTERGEVDIYNAHLTGSDPDPQAAAKEIEGVLAFIRETRGGAGPVILAGDFNAEPSDASIRALLDAGFIDAMADAGDAICEQAGDPGCTSGTIPLAEPGNRADRRIDYVFVLPGDQVGIDVRQASPFQNQPIDLGGGRLLWPSDHIGVQAELSLEER